MSTTRNAEKHRSTSIATGRLKRQAVFVTTHWSAVLSAGRADTKSSHDALAKLCQSYWYPLYAYVRRRGNPPADAQDLTQAFFEQLLERQSLACADPQRGRFRSFLLTALNNFLVSEWKKAKAKKRGGAWQILSLDLAAAEHRYDLEPSVESSPDKAYDKQWALTLLNAVLNKLEEEYKRADKADFFAELKQTLTGRSESQPYGELAVKLKMNEGTIKVAVHRLRKRFRELIRAEIANTVASPGEVNSEMQHLLAALTGN